MNRKLLASLLLGAAIGISGAAQAENMIKGVSIPDNEWPAVQEKCNALAAAKKVDDSTVNNESSSSTDNGGSNGGTDNGGNNGGTGNGGGTDNGASNSDSNGSDDQVGSEMNKDLTKSIDLDTVIYQDCVDAGLVTNP